nr:hypothetical protein [Tanacetum cinerariifolium]
LVLVLCVVHPHDQNPSISCPLTGCNQSPPFWLSFVVANGISRDCQGVLWWGKDSKAKRVCLVVQEEGEGEAFNNQTVDELPPTVPSFDPTCYSEDGNSFTYDSTSNLVYDSPNIFDPPPQP